LNCSCPTGFGGPTCTWKKFHLVKRSQLTRGIRNTGISSRASPVVTQKQWLSERHHSPTHFSVHVHRRQSNAESRHKTRLEQEQPLVNAACLPFTSYTWVHIMSSSAIPSYVADLRS
jgi:hypothetical protein